jgi:hypothetical protein
MPNDTLTDAADDFFNNECDVHSDDVDLAFNNFKAGAEWAVKNDPRILSLVEAMGGCSDGNCRIREVRRGGQHTNGGCHCRDNIKYALEVWKAISIQGT